MITSPMSASPLGVVVGRAVLPLLTYVAIAVLAEVLPDPVAARESQFLALWSALGVAVLTALGWPVSGRGRQMQWPAATALLAVTVAWVGHHQPYRGATLSLILLLGLCMTLRMAWQRSYGGAYEPPQGEGAPATASSRIPLLDAGITVPAALGFQLALRPELLLAANFDLRSVVSLVVLPTVAGLALALLAERHDPRRVALAGATAMILGPGWNVTTTLALAALAAGSAYADPRRAAWFRWIGVASLLALPWWLGGTGLLFALAGFALAASSGAAFLVLISTAAIGLLMPAARPKAQAFMMLLAALSMLPSSLIVSPRLRWRMRQGGLIALAAAMIGNGPEALACGLALLALSAPVEGAIFELQRAWTATVLLGTSIFAAYPWLRAEPRGALLRLVDIEPRGTDLLLPFVLVIGLGTVLQLLRHLLGRWTPPTTWCVVALLALVLLDAQQPVNLLRHSYDAVVLDDRRELLRQQFDEQPVRAVVVDSNMVHGLSLDAGTVVADVVLRDSNNQQVYSWPLKVGVHTAEWAVARPDIAGRPDLQVPPPWVSQIAADGTFFARRFRGRFQLAEPPRAAHLHIRRRADLPTDVQLVIYRLELRR